VQPVFEAFVAANGLSQRLSFRGGDFLMDALPPARSTSWVISSMGSASRISSPSWTRSGGIAGGRALIVYDSIIDDERRENALGLLMSLNMLIETPAGYDYTGADCIGWMRETGFRDMRAEHLAGPPRWWWDSNRNAVRDFQRSRRDQMSFASAVISSLAVLVGRVSNTVRPEAMESAKATRCRRYSRRREPGTRRGA